MAKGEQAASGASLAERLKSSEWARSLGLERAADLARSQWDVLTYGVILLFGIVIRFYDLGSRAIHHDESLHSKFSYDLANGIKFVHEPFMHGMFQFMGNAAVMKLLGDSDYTARVLAATMGAGLILLPFLLRDYLGRVGTLVAALFIAISPTLFYFSRFTREDIYTAFWTLALVTCIWRYLVTQRDGWLFGAAAMLAFSFATKETTFMTALIFLVFLNYLVATEVGGRIADALELDDPLRRFAVAAVLFPVAWLVVVAWPFLGSWRERYRLEWPAAATPLLVLGTLTAPQFTAGLTQKVLGDGLGIGWFKSAGFDSAPGDHIADGEKTMAQTSLLAMIFLTAYVGMLWDVRRWLIAGGMFYFIFTFLFTTAFTNMAGFWSGIWGSLDYWLQEQHTRRGDQPEYYYFILLPVYEFMPLIVALIGTLYYGLRGQVRDRLITAAALIAVIAIAAIGGETTESVRNALGFTVVMVAILLVRLDLFTRFLLFWFMGVFMGLTLAGEKMPWLNTHLALPLALLAARYVYDFFRGTHVDLGLPAFERWAPYVYVVAGAGLGTVVFIAVGPFTAAAVGGWLLFVVAAGACVWAYLSYAPNVGKQVAVAGVLAVFEVFTFKVAWQAAIRHGDEPRDMLIYTQTTRDLRQVRDEIDRLAVESGLGYQLPIDVDATDGFAWPWSWYLRKYRNVGYPTMGPDYVPREGAVVLAAKSNAGYIDPGAHNLSEGVPYRHRAWFPENYRGYSFARFVEDLLDPSAWSYWRRFFFERELPAPTGSADAVAFFPASFQPGLPGAAYEPPDSPTVVVEGNQVVLGGSGARAGQYQQPADVDVGPDGSIYVVDTGNHRVQRLGPDGNAQVAIGGIGQSEGRFAQPPGTTDGPWGVAVAPDGSVYVADTWNHRIQKFDRDLNFVKAWGAPYIPGQELTPLLLFGPRSIAIDADGNVLVADTGNGRIVKYSPDGEPLGTFGKKFALAERAEAKPGDGDPALDELWEPVGIAIGPGGDIFIADYWNLRIVRITASFEPIGAIEVPSWGSNYVTDRPYVLVLDDGRLLATDPAHGTVLVFGPDGTLLHTYEVPDRQGTPARPIGLARAADGDILVSDSAGNVVRKIPLSEIAP